MSAAEETMHAHRCWRAYPQSQGSIFSSTITADKEIQISQCTAYIQDPKKPAAGVHCRCIARNPGWNEARGKRRTFPVDVLRGSESGGHPYGGHELVLSP